MHRRSIVDHFDDFWTPEPNTGCRLWLAGCTTQGYGELFVDGKVKLAHVHAYERKHGPIPKGVFVLHHCDTRPCVNEDHLFAGTQLDNMRDMVKKGRQKKPTPLPARCTNGHKLTSALVYRYKNKAGKERWNCRRCCADSTAAYKRRQRSK